MNLLRNVTTPDKSIVKQHGQPTALLVLPGLGMQMANWHRMANAFDEAVDADCYLPDFYSRVSLDVCVEKLHRFVVVHDLAKYEKVYVVAYILGGWIFTRYMQRYPLENLGAVVFDRSPLQELAPQALTHYLKLPTRLIAGSIVQDLAAAPYIPLHDDSVQIGLMIENDVTPLMRLFKRYALAAKPLTWDAHQFKQLHSDAIYLPLNHDEMYTRFDVFTGEVAHFFAHGCFSSDAQRSPYVTDPYNERL